MSRSNRKFEFEEKHQILREEETNGFEVTYRKYQVARSLYYCWKNKFDLQGLDGRTHKHHRIAPQAKDLEKEKE